MIINYSSLLGSLVAVIIALTIFELSMYVINKLNLSKEKIIFFNKAKKIVRYILIIFGIISAIIGVVLAPVKQIEVRDNIVENAEVNNNKLTCIHIEHKRDKNRDSIEELLKINAQTNKEFDDFINKKDDVEPPF